VSGECAARFLPRGSSVTAPVLVSPRWQMRAKDAEVPRPRVSPGTFGRISRQVEPPSVVCQRTRPASLALWSARWETLFPMRASPVRKSCLASLAILAAVGCGTVESSHPAPEQTIALNWREAPGPPGNRLIVDVRRFVVRREGWAVSARVENDSPATLLISRRHSRHGTEFGLVVLGTASPRAVHTAGPGSVRSRFFASRFAPALPVSLRPGEKWSGTFSGASMLPAGDYVRIELGSFGASGTLRPPISVQFVYITDHAFRLSARD
jgi:hypothetical protein